jgi:hypothetical protein
VNRNGGGGGDDESERGEEGRRRDAAGRFGEGKVGRRSLSAGHFMAMVSAAEGNQEATGWTTWNR